MPLLRLSLLFFFTPDEFVFASWLIHRSRSLGLRMLVHGLCDTESSLMCSFFLLCESTDGISHTFRLSWNVCSTVSLLFFPLASPITLILFLFHTFCALVTVSHFSPIYPCLQFSPLQPLLFPPIISISSTLTLWPGPPSQFTCFSLL